MKRNWLIIVILFLLTANLAFVGVLLIRNNRANIIPPDEIPNFRGINKHEGPGKFEMSIADKLEMNEQQRSQLRILSQDFHLQKDKLRQRIGNIKKEYFENLASGNADTLLLDDLADSLGNLYAMMIKHDFQHYKNLKSICTPEQANRFDSLGRLRMNVLKNENCLNNMRRQRNSGNKRKMYN